MTIKKLNERWSVPSNQDEISDPLHCPSMEFVKIRKPESIPFGDTNYSENNPQFVPPTTGDFLIVCDDGNESTWGGIAFRFLPNNKVHLLCTYGRDCWAEWLNPHYENMIGKIIQKKEFLQMVMDLSQHYQDLFEDTY